MTVKQRGNKTENAEPDASKENVAEVGHASAKHHVEFNEEPVVVEQESAKESPTVKVRCVDNSRL